MGASSGLGRGLALRLVAEGARVAVAARRRDRLQALAAEAGTACVPLVCDVRDESSCQAAVTGAVEALGGLDYLIYCSGVGPLRRLVDADQSLWSGVMATNVIGAALVTRAAAPHLERSGGKAVFLSSISAGVTPPWPGLGLYGVSKAALERLVQSFQAELPDVAFTRMIIGPAGVDAATEFANGWDPDLAGDVGRTWVQKGYMGDGLVSLADIGDQLVALLAAEARVECVVIVPG
ncbi:MAG: SDR family oxidoreductase [Acidimicrobiales bacterium]